MGEKTEKATPKKLRDARKKGQVAKSQDVSGAFTFVVSISVAIYLIGWIYNSVAGYLLSAFSMITAPDVSSMILAFFQDGMMKILILALPILIAVNLVGVLITFLTVGPTWAPEVFKFDIKKFDPVQNIKGKFKMKTLVELLKQLAKITVAAIIIYTIIQKSIPALTQTVGLPLEASLVILHSFIMEAVIKIGVFFVVVGVADLVYQKHTFAKEMKMEKFEVKQEHKNSEGDPQIKGKRKQIAQEIAYQDGPAAAVQKAAAVVTNPTHLAIAIGYEQEVDPAPYILAMGGDALAEQMIKVANEHGVPIMRNVPLARRLWDTGEVYEYVPEETYEALAEILQWVASLNQDGEIPDYTEEELYS